MKVLITFSPRPSPLVLLWTAVTLILIGAFLGPGQASDPAPMALRLDGADDRVEIRDSRNLDFAGPFTIEAWIRPNGWGPDPTGGFARILDKSSYTLFLNRRGTDYMDRTVVLFLVLKNGNAVGVSGPADAVKVGVWTHVAFTYDGASAVTLVIDGRAVPVFQPAGPPDGPLADGSWSPLFIGDSPNQERFFNGDIGPIRLWSAARSPEAIAADRYRPAADGENLAANWSMAAESGAALIDASGNGNDGEIRGATWVTGPRPESDADGDGTPDSADGCPLDPEKTAPGACGCGVPDTDADQDGIADCKDPNQSPNAPVPVYPPDDLFPVDAWPLTLRTGLFSDEDAGDVLTAALWQVAGADEFSPPLFEVRTQGGETGVDIPPLLLAGGTAYRWRVRHFDETGDASPWSPEFHFTTRSDAQDADGNGVPDGQEPDPDLDLDGNSAPDETQPGLLAAETAAGAGPFAVRSVAGAAVEALAAFAVSELAPPAPNADTPMGLVAFRCFLETRGGLAQLRLYPPAAVPPDAPWIARNGDGRWTDLSGIVTPTADGDGWALRLTDGGPGDLDGTANGRAVVLLGPTALVAPPPAPEADAADGDGGGGGCFLEALGPHAPE